MGVIRTVMLFPLMIAPVIAGVLWRTLFHPTYGVINASSGWSAFRRRSGLIPEPGAARGDHRRDLAEPTGRRFRPGGRHPILPVDLYKAAHVDGASQWQIFTRITLPLLRPVILVLLLLRIMDAFKVFDIVFTMTYGGRSQTTELLSMLIYKTGLRFFQIGQASAMSWVFLVGIFHLRFTSSASCSAG